MRLRSLSVESFRNLEQVSFEPSEGATVVVGENGQGKTNLLESLYLLATLKPLRASKLSELVRFGHARARVSGRFELGGVERTVSVEIAPPTRRALVDGKKAARLEDYFGGLSVVAFTPDDLAVVKGGPDRRRTFLDRAVFNRFPAFLSETRAYKRALDSRNRLLKERAPDDLLEVYEEQLARFGGRIWNRRRAVVDELKPLAQTAFGRIGRCEAPADFDCAPTEVEGFAQRDELGLVVELKARLERKRAADRERGFTSVGPHADDLRVRLGERLAKHFASQGQIRALVLSWKIAEIENLRAQLGYMPLLLLDDVSSELDPERNRHLMRYLSESGAQVFLTTTDGALVEGATGEATRWFRVRAGTVEPSTPLRPNGWYACPPRRPPEEARLDPVGNTAMWVAAARALETEREGERLFEDPFARALAGDEGFAVYGDRQTTTVRSDDEDLPVIPVRTRFLDDSIAASLAAGLRQTAVLAAGMDARAWRLDWPAGMRVFELDRAEMLAEKNRRIGGAPPRCERIEVPIDLRLDWPEALRQVGFDPTKPTLWLVEGLLLYLEAADVDRLLGRLSALSAKGSALYFDLMSRRLLDSPMMRARIEQMAAAGAAWRFGTDDPEGLLAPLGWEVTPHDFAEVGHRYGRWPFPVIPKEVTDAPRSWLTEAHKKG